MFVGDMPLLCIGEGFFYGFPSWEVIHFIWMIAWRWESFINHEIPHDCHRFYLEKVMDQQEGFHNNLPLFHKGGHWVYSPKDNLHTWEEPLGDGIFAEILKQWWRLLDEEATREEGDILHHP